MDASNKQETLAEKFARVWEKKNSKAARAGGVSLMALSLAACGSSSDTTTEVEEPVVEEPVVEEPTTPVAPTPTCFFYFHINSLYPSVYLPESFAPSARI